MLLERYRPSALCSSSQSCTPSSCSRSALQPIHSLALPCTCTLLRTRVPSPLHPPTRRNLLMFPQGNKSANGAGGPAMSLYLAVPDMDDLPMGWTHSAHFKLTLLNQLNPEESMSKCEGRGGEGGVRTCAV
jgi:hypothetical protein